MPAGARERARPAIPAGMKGASLAALLLACTGLGGVAGWWLGTHAARERHAPPPAHADAQRASRTRASTGIPAPGLRTPGPGDDLGRESGRALRDPAYLRNLLQRYAAEREPDRKGALLAVLQASANDDVLRFALEHAASADPDARRDGLALLRAFPLDRAEVRDALVNQLRGERAPAMQAELIDMLAPVQVADEDAAPLRARLAQLRQSPDAAVRAAAVRQGAQWERGAQVEPMLHQALLDPDPGVRLAALSGVYLSGARSDRLRDALLATAGDARAGDAARQAAIMGLQHFVLDRAEYAIYREAADALADAHAH